MLSSKKHLLELTSVRFIAALGVVLMHFSEYLKLPRPLAQIVGAGGIGVTFFFVLSGFILSYNYEDHFRQDVSYRRFRAFILSRLFRIYPAYLLSLVLVTLLYVLIDKVFYRHVDWPVNTVASWLANAFAMQTFSFDVHTQQFWNAPSWSISTELCFYIIFPFLSYIISRYCSGRATLVMMTIHCVTLASLLQIATLLGVHAGWFEKSLSLDYFASRNVLWKLWEFIAGIVAAHLLFGGHFSFLQQRIWRNTLLLVCLCAVFGLTLLPWPATEASAYISRQFRMGVLNILPFMGIIVALAAGETFLSSLLQRREFVLLGEASFALYIYHWLPLSWFNYLKTPAYVFTPWDAWLAIGLSIGFSVLSFKWYETPLRGVLRKLSRLQTQSDPIRNYGCND